MRIAKIAGGVLAVVLIVIGGVWILQGVNVLPGSFMTGRIEWAYRGGVAALIGLALLVFLRRSGGSASK